MAEERTLDSGMRVWTARPDTPGRHPAVLMLHERYGPVQYSFDAVGPRGPRGVRGLRPRHVPPIRRRPGPDRGFQGSGGPDRRRGAGRPRRDDCLLAHAARRRRRPYRHRRVLPQRAHAHRLRGLARRRGGHRCLPWRRVPPRLRADLPRPADGRGAHPEADVPSVRRVRRAGPGCASGPHPALPERARAARNELHNPNLREPRRTAG